MKKFRHHSGSLDVLEVYLLTPWSRVLLEKPTGFQPVNKFPAIYGTRRFIPRLQVPATRPYPEPDQSSPWPPTYILILTYHLCLGLPSGLFPSGFPTKTLYTPLLSLDELYAPLISFFSIWQQEYHLACSTESLRLAILTKNLEVFFSFSRFMVMYSQYHKIKELARLRDVS